MHVSTSSSLQGSEGPPPQQPGRILLDVVVTDKAGKPVTGLKQGEFTVLDNKKPQPLLSFQAVDASVSPSPVEVILLVDTVNTGFVNVANERHEIDKFLRFNGGKLAQPVTLIILSDTATKVQNDSSRDGNGLSEYLRTAESSLREINRSAGFDGAVERFQLSLTTIQSLANYEASRRGRKLLIWVSPGWPILSGPNVELTRKQAQGIFDTVVSLTTALRQAQITLYSVDPLGTEDAISGRTEFYKVFLKGVTSASRVDIGDLALQVLADHTGGLVLNSSNDAAGEIARCVQDASAYYSLSIQQPAASEPRQYHDIDVKIAVPGLTARTRTGYYAQP